MLHEAAEQFKSVRLTEPDMKYQDFVAGTAIEGIDNFEALDKEEQGKFAIEFAASAEKMAPKELQFEKDTENYRQHYDKDASTLPYQEWRKTFTMDRQANKILRPNEETAIQAAEDKMMKEYEHPDIAADIKAVVQAHKDYDAEQDMLVAKAVSESPTPVTFQQMKAENILGTKQLEADTKYANERLVNTTARWQAYGHNKPLNPGAMPNYQQTEKIAKKIQQKKTLKEEQERLLKDAQGLADSGSPADQEILEADQKAALAGEPPMTKEARESVRKEHAEMEKMKKNFGKKAMEDMKKSTKAAAARSEKAFEAVKEGATASAVGPKYGAEALKSLPTRSKDPQLENPADYNLNGNDQDAGMVKNKNSPPGDGSSKMPTQNPEAKAAEEEAASEPKASRDYKAQDAAIAAGTKSEGQTAKEQAMKVEGAASLEAKIIEGDLTKGLYKDPLTGGVDELAIEEKTAGQSEEEIADATDTKKVMKEVNSNEWPDNMAEKDDKPYEVWDTAGVHAELDAHVGSVAKQDDLDTDVTSAGVPKGQPALPAGAH